MAAAPRIKATLSLSSVVRSQNLSVREARMLAKVVAPSVRAAMIEAGAAVLEAEAKENIGHVRASLKLINLSKHV